MNKKRIPRLFYFWVSTKKNVLVFIVLGLLLFSCKKDPDFYPVSDEFKPWFLFQQGSFWIFQNDSTLDLDSVYIKSPPAYYNVPNPDRTYSRQAISIQYQSSFFEFIDVLSSTSGSDFLSIHIYNSIVFPGLISNFPIKGEYKSTSGSATVLFENLRYYPDYILNFTHYKDVCQTRWTYTEPTFNKIFNFYFAKNIGLIKVDGNWNDTSRSWSLLRYHAVQ